MPKRQFNYDDFMSLPNDGKRYEILDGMLYISPPSLTAHQRVLLNLATTLSGHVEQCALGEVFIAPYDLVLSYNDIAEPDIIFVSTQRQSIVTKENIRGVPDLVVEVLSPVWPAYDTREKRNVYERCGVPNYWLVDPDAKQLTELQLTGSAYATIAEVHGEATFSPRLFPGLHIPLGDVWPK